MAETDRARAEIDRSRERIAEIAEELARRASPANLKARAKEATVRRTQEWREQIGNSPTALAVIGGVCGSLLGSWLGRRARARHQEPWRGYAASAEQDFRGRIDVERYDVHEPAVYETSIGHAGEVQESGSGIGAKASELKDRAKDVSARAKDAAGSALESARSKVGGVRHNVQEKLQQMPSKGELKYQAGRFAENQPLILGLGALALGALAGALIPVSQKERELIGTARDQLQDKLQSVGESLEQKLSGEQQGEAERGASAGLTQAGMPEGRQEEPLSVGDESPPTPLH